MKLQYFTLFLLSINIIACTHTLKFRAAHFASPVVSEKQWSGHAALIAASITKVTIINDVETNPPRRDEVLINADLDAGDLLMLNRLGLDISLSPLKSLELYIQDAYGGLRWQLLNHSAKSDAFVAAIHGALASKSSSSTTSISGGESKSSSDIRSRQGGISIGYKFKEFVPYLSYIYENHKASTRVDNPNGSFGPYEDSGIHQYYAIGFSTHKVGGHLALEYNRVQILWDRSKISWQDSTGLKLGYAW